MIVERRFASGVYYGTQHGLYVGMHPHNREPGVEFTLLKAPSEGSLDPEAKQWCRERWRCVSAGDHVEVMLVSRVALTDEQIARIKRAFPDLWP